MATGAAGTKRKRRGLRRWLILLVVVLVVAGGGFFAFSRMGSQSQATVVNTGWQTVAATTGDIEANISATGNIEPRAQAELRFATSGIITEILVKVGDQVQVNQALARLDAADLALRVTQAEADLKQAQADRSELTGGAPEQDLIEARARVAQARSQYQQTVSSVSAADLAAARDTLAQAQARLARLEAGPANDTLTSSQVAAQSAQASLEQARTDLATAKERARLDVDARANALRNLQDDYSTIYWQNQAVAKQYASFGQELPQDARDREAAALRAVHDGETALAQAQLAYTQAQRTETTTLQAREADVKRTQADLNELLKGARPEDLADARAAVSRAQASLDQLSGANRSSQLASQQANVTIAQVGLDKLLADPNTSQLVKAEAAVVRADVALTQAQRELARATLTAPYAATIANIDMRIGESTAQTGLILIADLSSLHVDVPVDELDVALVALGQPATITFDALPGRSFTGQVTTIAPLATRSDQGTTTYKATITLDTVEAQVRSGMTAVVEVITARKQGIILIPRRAVIAEGGKSYVQVPLEGKPADPLTRVPANEKREVTLGLSNSESVEITSGLNVGDKVLVQDISSTLNPMGGI